MIKNYFKIAFRNLMNNKLYTGINLIGLSVGLGISMLIFLFIQHENSFDNFHENKAQLTRLLWESGEGANVDISASTPMAAPIVLKEKFDNVEKATHYLNTGALMKKEGEKSQDEQFRVVSADFFDMFSFDMLQGPENPFAGNAGNSIVVTESGAERYFGTTDVIGKILLIQLAADFEPFVIKSVMADLPTNSSIHFEFLLPEHTLKTIIAENYTERWYNTYGGCFLQLKEGTSLSNLEEGFASFIDETVKEGGDNEVYKLMLQPLDEVHLDVNVRSDIATTNPRLLWILSGVSILILLIACINFTTLSIGRSATRAKEVGVRKTMGALYKQLFGQFMTESIVMTFISALIGIVLASMLLPVFNNLFGKSLEIVFSPVQIGIITGLLLVITFLAGAYPALFLSQLRPITVLKSSLNVNFGKQGLRKFLLGFQLFLSLFLLACTLIMYQQMKAVNEYNLGFTKDNVLMVQVPAIPDQSIIEIVKKSFEKAERFRTVVEQNSAIEKTAIANATYGNNTWWHGGFPDKEGEMHYFRFSFVGPNYTDVLGLEFTEGRGFNPDSPSDSNAVIVNEAFVELMQMENPLREEIYSAHNEGFQNRIIGVLKDFHHTSLYDKIEPLMISQSPEAIMSGINSLGIGGGTNPNIYIKSATDDFSNVISTLEAEWNKMYPDEPFTFSFLDEVVQRQYIADERLGKMVAMAAIIAILIAAMGLFALASLAITGRLKEIGIRKVLGASTLNISMLFNKEFLKITVIGVVAAVPVSYWLMVKWLEQFEVKNMPGVGVFALTVLLGVSFTTIIVSVQTVSASLMNPVKSLKEE